MYGSAQEFFEQLQAEADPARAADLTASYRFDIAGAGSWRVDVRAGAVNVTGSQEPADCVIGADEETFLGVVRGEQSPVGAFMAGKIRVERDLGLALRLRDLIG